MATGKLKVVVTDGAGLNKIYVNTKSGYSYNLDSGRMTRKGRQKVIEEPHIDANYPKSKPVNIEKKKLFINE